MAGDNEADEALKSFEKAYEEYLNSFKAALIENGTKAYIQGDLKAQKALNLKLSFNLVNKEALKYIKEYKKELNKGGSTIQGKFIPWLEDKSKEERAAISKILEEGYKAGKATGVKQLIKGGAYPKNSIAYDLQEYFNSRKSHAATVARTEIARIQSHGSMRRYEKQGVNKVMWLVFNPCPICAQYARRVYERDKVPLEIPAHPACRCCFSPVPDDVPIGPAPDQPVPEVFEREAKALPPKYSSPEDIRKSIKRETARLEAESKALKDKIKTISDELDNKFEEYDHLGEKLRDPKTYFKSKAEFEEAKKLYSKMEDGILPELNDRMWLEIENLDKINGSTKNVIRELFYINDGEPSGMYRLYMGFDLPEPQAGYAKKAEDFLNKVVTQKIRESPGRMPIQIVDDRSWTDKDNIIRLRKNRDEVTLIHETGHNLEFKNPGFKKAAQDYLKRRTAGEQPQKLKDLTGIDYDDWETTRPDKFINPYVGKEYSDGSTEVISMGLQYLYEDPAGLAEQDPELFDLIVNGIRGAYDS